MPWSRDPQQISNEAPYPFAVSEGQVLYHAPNNVCNAMLALSWMKRRFSIIILPLLALHLGIHGERDFQLRKGSWAWVFTALQNIAFSNKIFSCNLPHKVQNELERWPLKSLLERHKWLTSQSEIDWKETYRRLLPIAKNYDLAPDESNYRFTTSSYRGVLGLGKSFETSSGMLYRARKYCNKHAVAAGYDETDMYPMKLIYWWAHHLCSRVQDLKKAPNLKSATSEEIAFTILGRFGLPIDHGIAMIFGLTATGGVQAFNPIDGFDIDQCTVTVETATTNTATGNFPATSWDGVRQALSRVPLSHPCGCIHPDTGGNLWVRQRAR
ncbi:hypothetical protein C8A03DRAFT_44029 [Achaetomium macrosporum]|uniref:Uncharacterized protein n=1 Tax=Achaetomium macrosporum TaxID=79813 RepID=A0AAN7HC99_9PEZI|nr:hypothetical protein C8A03DRAFT_44029 [Achaetomium macrosporum]